MADLPRADRLAAAIERDGSDCVWCRRPFADRFVRATVDHVVPRLKGGPAWLENEVAACSRCNRERAHRSPVDFLVLCEQRGWEPNRGAIVRSLRSLADAIAARGGQRRARPYLDAQLRRLDRASL